jgi:hypothetical protein
VNTEKFEGTATAMKESPWLASEDLIGRGTIKLKIEAVFKNEGVKFEGGRTEKKPLFSVKFAGIPKQLILNATNRKTLVEAFGATVKSWIGKPVQLTVKDGIRKPGTKDETCCGLRLIANPDKSLIGGVSPEPTQTTPTEPQQNGQPQ